MPIATALKEIQQRRLILPAIQREYVWKPSQVIRVFDSVMRGYPVGSFLSWRVEPETINKFKFYGFMKDYNAFDNRHNPVIDIPADREVIAVLDGQQRLTSLNIELRRHLWLQESRRLGEQAMVLPQAPSLSQSGGGSPGE